MKHLNLRRVLSTTAILLSVSALVCLVLPEQSTYVIMALVAAWHSVLNLWNMLPPIVQKLPAISALFIVGMQLHSEEYGHELHKEGQQGIMQRFVRLYLQPKSRHLVTLDRLKVFAGAIFWLTALTWGILPELTTVPKEYLQVVILVFGLTCTKLILESTCGMITRLAGSDHERLVPGQPHVLQEWTEIPGGKVMLRPIKCIVVERGLFSVAFEPIEEADENSLFQPFINRSYSQLLLGDRKYLLPKRAKQVQSNVDETSINDESDDDNSDGALVEASDAPSDEPPSSPAGILPSAASPVKSEPVISEQAKPGSKKAGSHAPKAQTLSRGVQPNSTARAAISSSQADEELQNTQMDAAIEAIKSVEPISNVGSAAVVARESTPKHVHSDCLKLRSMKESDIRNLCVQDMQNFCPLPHVVLNSSASTATCAGTCAESKKTSKSKEDKDSRSLVVDLSDGLDPSEVVMTVNEEEEGGEHSHF